MNAGVLSGSPGQPSNAFPKILLSTRARNSFATNLRQAMNEDDSESSIDPLHTSRHVGSAARKRAEDEKKAREEEDAMRDSRSRPQWRTVTPNSYPQGANHIVPSHKGKEVAGPSSGQHILTYSSTPAPRGEHQNPPPPPSKMTRNSAKPPGLPHEYSHIHPPPPSFQQQQAYTYPPPSPHHHPHHLRSQSPISPMVSPQNDRLSPVYHRNGNGVVPSHNGHSHSPSLSRHDSPSQPHATTQNQQQPSYSGVPPQESEPHRHAKPKRLKAHTVTSKSFSIPMVPRDKKGQPMLPLNVGIMTVVSLGEVCMREHFHTERYIFPVGYEVTRYVSHPSVFGR